MPSSQRTPIIAEELIDAHPADVLTCRVLCPVAVAMGAPTFTDYPVSVSPGHAVGQRAAFGAEQHQEGTFRRRHRRRQHAEGAILWRSSQRRDAAGADAVRQPGRACSRLRRRIRGCCVLSRCRSRPPRSSFAVDTHCSALLSAPHPVPESQAFTWSQTEISMMLLVAQTWLCRRL